MASRRLLSQLTQRIGPWGVFDTTCYQSIVHNGRATAGRSFVSASSPFLSKDNLNSSLDTPFCMNTTRQFATKRRKGKIESGLLTNEQLVKSLMSRIGTSSANDIKVRVLRDAPPGSDQKGTTHVVSLPDAIQKAVELDEDLIEISLDQEVPVVQIANLNSFLYKKTKKKKAKTTSSLPAKEFRFKAGIAENDLERKVNQMVKLLARGHNCMVTVSCRHWQVRDDPDITLRAVERVLLQVQDWAELVNPPKLDGRRIHATFTLYPSPKLKKEATSK